MADQVSSDVKLEIGHALFIDIVGYSKLLINEQSEPQAGPFFFVLTGSLAGLKRYVGYVIRRFNASSTKVRNPRGPDLRWNTA